jgi:probable HAF family extracellular repeat protein
MRCDRQRVGKTPPRQPLRLLALAVLPAALVGWKLTGPTAAPSPLAHSAVSPPGTRVAAPTGLDEREEPAAAGTSAYSYELTDLGTLGGASSWAGGLNNAGDVVGTSMTDAGEKHAFLYRHGRMQDLGTLGGHESAAYAINDSGHIVGQIQGLGRTDRPFLWRNGEMRVLGDFHGRVSDAHGISSSGQVVGECLDPAEQRFRGFFLVPDRTHQPLGTLGGSESRAFGINDAGQVVGVSSTRYDLLHHAFLWHQDTIRDLGTLGGSNSEARAINVRSQVVGTAQTSDDYEHAFLYSDGVINDLGTLGGNSSRAFAINAYGAVVGQANAAAERARAFLWLHGTLMDLNGLIAPHHDWLLTCAYAINDAGQIAGRGLFQGKPRAFLLTPVTGQRARR